MAISKPYFLVVLASCFHMRYSSMICYKRLQSDRLIVRLPTSPLVLIDKTRHYIATDQMPHIVFPDVQSYLVTL